MNISNEYDALVIIGAWNSAIFTQEWVSKNLLPGQSIQVEYPISGFGASLRFRVSGVSMSIVGHRLAFHVSNPTDEQFRLIYQTAIRISQILPHTPLVSIGINHIFKCTVQEIEDKHIFDFSDQTTMNNNGYELVSWRNQRTLHFGHHDLNLIWRLDGTDVSVEFNNDYRVSDFISFSQIFSDNIIQERKVNAIDFIRRVYNIEVI